jgi:hypothetical protein
MLDGQHINMNSSRQHRDRSPGLAPVVWALITGTLLPVPLMAGTIFLVLHQVRFDLLAVVSAISIFGGNGVFVILGLLAVTVVVLTGMCTFTGFVVASMLSRLTPTE